MKEVPRASAGGGLQNLLQILPQEYPSESREGG